MSRLIVLYGATGIGKSSLSIELAKRLGVPILSSDSRQVFREMEIGTAVPREDELAAVPHFFIQDRSIFDGFSAGDFQKEALVKIGELFEINKTLLVVGGSNLYINALLNGLDDLPRDAQLRAELNKLTLNELQKLLERLDPEYYKEVDQQNIARVRRAVEVSQIAGQPYSSLLTGGERANRDFSVLKIGLERPRAELYQRIEQRVDQMVEQGLEREAKKLYPHRELPALQTVGYREWFEFFDGEIERERAVELIKQHTRNYAKRQITWLRKESGIKWFSPNELDLIMEYIEQSK